MELAWGNSDVHHATEAVEGGENKTHVPEALCNRRFLGNFYKGDIIMTNNNKLARRAKAERCPVQNEDHAKHGTGHTGLYIGEFLNAEANEVPGTSFKTWRWWGEDYYARCEGQSEDDATKAETIYITLYINDSIENWLRFSPKNCMELVYDSIR